MSIVLIGSTSGSCTLQEQAVAGTTTLTLPTTSGTLVTNANGDIYPLTSGTAVASTSGTSIDFTSIPSWVKRITVMFSGVSTSGTNPVQIQLGTGSTTYTTSGYLGSATNNITGSTTSNHSTGFLTSGTGDVTAASIRHGQFIISLFSGNTWTISGNSSLSNTNCSMYTSGSIPLAAALTAVRITTVGGTDTFDAGSINILYE